MNDQIIMFGKAILIAAFISFLIGLTALSVHAVYEAVQPIDKPCMRDEHGRKRDCDQKGF